MPEFVRHAWVSDCSHSLATLLNVWKVQVTSGPCSDPDLMVCAAATVGDIPLLQELLQRGEADTDCEIEKPTALVSAARAAKDNIIESLIPHVSNFDNTSWSGGTALHCAIRDGADETIRLLLPHKQSNVAVWGVENRASRPLSRT
ncbi:hypothetical protein ASPVEDRAFT_80461 [Aspergillus versicolor CBS 583.65]|uniref:Uncharacterized protein n=1 Tax=Aspergillus versicolor CBS 583.65 TaxID=1036611 RepID=A0A1L9PBD9_ASPVE|nr:uncharacterized protein ASPVEDRAFT_80461 [Aspergillus versicolor CBS 583.65]OJI98831.1 hypothetical protein ASPVEDRAFT_80461 [Aspergillus versicolor CBS 583.65]